ncbi:ABC transporter permease [Conexibacter stalactiti]|uniref:ABC transporter permease n=1 Tax=Conexibacter stalactiti TaxID=1940611 RepID=A0ABU4HXQ8_9ACTN|nr:ABC transporter permease [Conexibacter stalactiti]MDW5596839.1 ABC transporter permease [Conexibacter stalactiti]MEC5037481.1 ABC transporter permease [Conexibacter stalactiti]
MSGALAAARAGRAPRGALARRVALRLATMVAVMVGAATVAFLALELVADDPVRTVIGLRPATPELLAQVRSDLGLDRSLPERWLLWVGGIAHGDLGTSYQLQRPVLEIVGEQLLPTVELALTAFLLGAAGGTLLALATAGRRPRARAASGAAELLALSTPPFWLGIVLLTVFSFQLGWFPVIGAGESGLRALVLPAVTLAVPIAAMLAQVLRDGLEQALAQPFATTARARGISELRLRTHHALRHALLAVMTLSGWIVGSLLGGAVVVETVFGRQGIGRVAATAISSADVPTVMGVVLLSSFFFVVVNALVDLLYPLVDPRLRGRA